METPLSTHILRVGSLFVIITVLAFWGHYIWDSREDTALESPVAITEQPAPEETGTVNVEPSGEGVAQEDAAPPAKRIVHVPDTRQAHTAADHDSDASEISGKNIPEAVSSLLDSALAGNLDDGYYAYQLRKSCLGWELNNVDLEKYVEEAMQEVEGRATSGNPVPPEGQLIPWLGFALELEGGPGIRIFPTEQQNLAHLMAWAEGCQKVQGLFSEDFRERLERLARDGNVVARYLYAVWEPRKTTGVLAYRRSTIRPLDDLNPGAFERNAEWQLNAIDFSHANLHEGEPAGLVAFGESYVSGKFTGSNHFLGMALIRAALQCNPELRRIEQLLLVLSMENDLDALVSDEATNTAILALADELSAYCR